MDIDVEKLKHALVSEGSKKICRSCLSIDSTNKDIYITTHVDSNSSRVLLYEMFYRCTQIEVSVDDKFPGSLCIECINRMTEAHRFYMQSKRSNDLLNKLYLDISQNTDNKRKNESELSDLVKCEELETPDDPLEDPSSIHSDDSPTSVDEHIEASKSPLENVESNDYYERGKSKERQPLYERPNDQQTCSVCNQILANTKELVRHRAKTHGKNKFQCLTCGNGFTTTRGLRIHTRQHSGEKPEVCTVCGKAFSDPRTLKSHIRLHSGDQKFPCTVCDKKYSSRINLENHMLSHSGERPHQCNLCMKTYRQAISLKVHMRVHSGYRPFKCDVCSKSFTNKTSLNIHTLAHNGVKNYQCPECGHCVSRSGELIIHMRSHSGVRPYKCDVCMKTFTNSGALKAHAPTHTKEKNFSCPVCGKTLSRASGLAVHMRTHTGVKEHACKYCDRKFSIKSNMIVHQRKHTGEKPLCCEECGSRFSDPHSLKNHRQSHVSTPGSATVPIDCTRMGCHRRFRKQSQLETHIQTHHCGPLEELSSHITSSSRSKHRKTSKTRLCLDVEADNLHEQVDNVRDSDLHESQSNFILNAYSDDLFNTFQ